jgi:hypothetical protein
VGLKKKSSSRERGEKFSDKPLPMLNYKYFCSLLVNPLVEGSERNETAKTG